MNLISLQFKTTSNFQENLDKLTSLINVTSENSFILAPELCLTGYSYDCMDSCVDMTNTAIPILKELSCNKIISLSMTTKSNDEYFNTLFIFSKGNIVHTQAKVKLFALGDEQKYFSPGNLEDIKIIDVEGIKVACLICFEIRFISLWQKIQGADVILVPAMWGKLRADNYTTLTNAVAVANECYVIAADSSNDDMAQNSGIITPFGIEYRDNDKEVISKEMDFREIKKMRKYLNIGIK